MAATDSASSDPPQSQPPIAQVPKPMRETGVGTFAQRIVSVTIKWTTRFLQGSLGLPRVTLCRFSFLKPSNQSLLVFLAHQSPFARKGWRSRIACDGTAK